MILNKNIFKKEKQISKNNHPKVYVSLKKQENKTIKNSWINFWKSVEVI